MKPILWILIGFALFVTLVGAVFVVLSYLDPLPESNYDTITAVPDSSSVSGMIIKSKNFQIDSLIQVIHRKDSLIGENNSDIDSLTILTTRNINTIKQRDAEIKSLKQIIASADDKASNIKDLAKTYEAMKTADIKPILSKVDDKTVIEIYKQMGSRSKKKILEALSAERAARITLKLAN